MSSNNHIIEVKNLTKSFDNTKAVKNISFQVKKGEILGFLGPNGAGKTTTIRMLTGVLKPDKETGFIKIFGLNLANSQLEIKQRIGNVPEMANIYRDLTGWQNLMFIGEIYGLNKNTRKQKAIELLNLFDLYSHRHKKAKQYSKGMKQRLLLGMALMNEPEILFLDEPTSGLDVQSSRIIMDIIKQINQENQTTIFLTTHNMQVANDLSDLIAIMHEGVIIRLDTPENLRKFEQQYNAVDIVFNKPIRQEILIHLEGIEKVRKHEQGFHIFLNLSVHKGMAQIMQFAKDHDLKIEKFDTHIPSLEDVFVKITQSGENH